MRDDFDPFRTKKRFMEGLYAFLFFMPIIGIIWVIQNWDQVKAFLGL